MLDVERLVTILISLGVADPSLAEVVEGTRQALAVPEWGEAHERALAGALADGTQAGLIEAWETADYGMVVSLTPLAAQQNRVKISYIGRDPRPRWTVRHPTRKELRAARDAADSLVEFVPPETLDLFVDVAQPEPWEQLASAERIAGAIGEKPLGDELDPTKRKMRVLLGLRVIWPPKPVVRDEQGQVVWCEGCRAVELGLVATCLWCDRSGIDRYLPSITKVARKGHRKGKLKGGVGA